MRTQSAFPTALIPQRPMRRVTPHTTAIRSDISKLGFLGLDPWHVEALMRLEHPTGFARLTPTMFVAEVQAACNHALAMSIEDRDALADRYFPLAYAAAEGTILGCLGGC